MKAITLKAARIVGPLTLEIDWSTGRPCAPNWPVGCVRHSTP